MKPKAADQERKPIKFGLGFVHDANQKQVSMTKPQAERWGSRNMPDGFKRCGFRCLVSDCGDYYRVLYGK
jgi:hypothetical protein